MQSEAEFETTQDVIDGRVLLDTRLQRHSPADLQAFWDAVRRCYAGAVDDTSDDDAG